jgi:hypothetical protein
MKLTDAHRFGRSRVACCRSQNRWRGCWLAAQL